VVREAGERPALWQFGWTGLALAELGRRDEALAAFAELAAVAEPADEHDTMRAHAYTQLVLGYVRLGERSKAASCAGKLIPFAGQTQGFLVDRAIGLAALSAGDRATGLRYLADAEALGRRESMLPDLWVTLVQRGVVEGDRARIAEGQRLAAELGMSALCQAGLEVAQTLSARAPLWPDGLSSREVDVLRLVAQGHTNRDIAARLVVSEKTVANHLTAVFTKTGVENRTAAAAYAFQHGLAEPASGR
jgi:DNA-binding CsgD family transcriptional regulator